MNLYHIRLDTDTITESGKTFKIDNVYGFTVLNNGTTDAKVGYQGGGTLFTVEAGEQREFPGWSGAMWEGIMLVRFEGGSIGNLEIVKGVLSTKETM